MLYTTILCASDGLEHSDRALRHAGELAAETGAQLHIVHIAETAPSVALIGAASTGRMPAERRMRITMQIAQLAQDHQLAVNRHFMFHGSGSVAARIAGVADEIGADLIVVGSHGRTALSAALLGSEAQRLTNLTLRPILVVAGDAARHPARELGARLHRRQRVPPAITAARLGDRR